MKFSATISLVFSVFGTSRLPSLNRWLTHLTAFQAANAAVTLIAPIPTSTPAVSSFSIPSFSLPSGVSFSLPSGVSIPSLSFPTPNPTASRSSVSFTFIATVSVGGVASSDGATTYFLQDIIGVNGNTTTETRTIVQGSTVWRADNAHETCSLDGKGGALCVIGAGGFQTSFTGSAIPIFTVPANAAGAGGSGGGSGSSNGSGGGSAPSGGAARVNGGASVGWMLVGTVAAMVAGMRFVL